MKNKEDKGLNIEELTPKVVEIRNIVKVYEKLEIEGVDDREGYKAVDEARKDLKKRRSEIKNFAKAMRDDAIKFQKAVIQKEKEVIAEIEPTEQLLIDRQTVINNEKLIIKMRELLPERIKELLEIEVVANEELLLLMDEKKYKEFYTKKKEEFLERKQQELKEKEDELKRKQEIADAVENARKEAIEETRKQAEKEKQEILDKQKRKEEDKRKADEQKEKEEREEKERIAKNQKYTEFLNRNGYKKDGDSFKIIKTDTEIILYKKLASFIY